MRGITGLLFGLIAASAALAQPYQIHQGNVLDANPRAGSAGFNEPGRRYPINAGNRIITGNVTGGLDFRGYSPISDPSAFGLARSGSLLPSDNLYGFNRDTFSVADVVSGRNLPYARSSYYSPSSTVVNTGGIVRGLNRPGTSQVQNPYLPPRTDLRAEPAPLLSLPTGSSPLTVAPRVERLDSGQVVAGPVNQRLLASPLFGAVRAVPADVLAAQAAQSAGLGADLATPIDGRLQPLAPLDAQGDPMRTPAPDAGMARRPGSMEPMDPALPAPGTGARPAAAPTARLGPEGRPDVETPVAIPGQVPDTFTAMQQMTGRMLRPLEPAQTLAQAGAAEREASGRLLQPLRPGERSDTAAQLPPAAAPAAPPLPMGPMRTFVGTERSVLNRYLSQAEAALRSGEYYRAEGLYDVARAIDARNPLPLLGRSLALLAAGEYVSSADSLFRAIRLYEELGRFPVDLTAFVPDVAMLDRRRADLEGRLEAVDDYRLRFLLGYAEYTSGLHALGLRNMKQAAGAAPADLAPQLQQFVTLLELHTRSTATRPVRSAP